MLCLKRPFSKISRYAMFCRVFPGGVLDPFLLLVFRARIFELQLRITPQLPLFCVKGFTERE
jgi:hypothetical protein